MTTQLNNRTAVKLLAASAARYGLQSRQVHKREESRFMLMPQGKDLVTVYNTAIKPVLQAVEARGKVGVRIVGLQRSRIAALLAECKAENWKWMILEDQSVIVLPRNNGSVTAEHLQEIQGAAGELRETITIGLGAVMRK